MTFYRGDRGDESEWIEPPGYVEPHFSVLDGSPLLADEDYNVTERGARIGAWWATRTKQYPLVETCERIATFQIPIDFLIEQLTLAANANSVWSLEWFVSPEGISRLHRLESEVYKRRGGDERSSRPSSIRDLLSVYEASR